MGGRSKQAEAVCEGRRGNMIPTRPIAIDTREQIPWEFRCPTVAAKIDSGDYSLFNAEAGKPILEHLVSIERKSLADFVGSITSGRERFEREILRLHDACEWPWIIVECSLTDLAAGEYRSTITPKTVFGTIEAWARRYRVQWVFAGDRLAAQTLAQTILGIADNRLKRCKQAASGSSELMFDMSSPRWDGLQQALATAGHASMGIAPSTTIPTHRLRSLQKPPRAQAEPATQDTGPASPDAATETSPS